MVKITELSCVIHSQSPDMLRAAERIVLDRVDLNRVYTDTVVRIANGTQQEERQQHRLGDYFDNIRIVESPANSCFTVVFHPRPDAGRFWRDLVAAILRSIRESATGVSIGSLSRT